MSPHLVDIMICLLEGSPIFVRVMASGKYGVSSQLTFGLLYFHELVEHCHQYCKILTTSFLFPALALLEHVNLVYGTISEFCTPSGCPDMTGPGNR